jgi:hypothetical protein
VVANESVSQKLDNKIRLWGRVFDGFVMMLTSNQEEKVLALYCNSSISCISQNYSKYVKVFQKKGH